MTLIWGRGGGKLNFVVYSSVFLWEKMLQQELSAILSILSISLSETRCPTCPIVKVGTAQRLQIPVLESQGPNYTRNLSCLSCQIQLAQWAIHTQSRSIFFFTSTSRLKLFFIALAQIKSTSTQIITVTFMSQFREKMIVSQWGNKNTEERSVQ